VHASDKLVLSDIMFADLEAESRQQNGDLLLYRRICEQIDKSLVDAQHFYLQYR
jgi:hypothetical protein